MECAGFSIPCCFLASRLYNTHTPITVQTYLQLLYAVSKWSIRKLVGATANSGSSLQSSEIKFYYSSVFLMPAERYYSFAFTHNGHDFLLNDNRWPGLLAQDYKVDVIHESICPLSRFLTHTSVIHVQ